MTAVLPHVVIFGAKDSVSPTSVRSCTRQLTDCARRVSTWDDRKLGYCLMLVDAGMKDV